MANGTRSGGNGHLTEVLDHCLDRMRQGDSIEQCLAAHPAYAGELEPLLRVGDELLASEAAATPLCDLSAGRQRLLAAAAARRADGNGTADALDAAIAAPAPDRDEPGGTPADLTDTLAALVETARTLATSVIVPPRPPTDLARGRDRLLAAAQAAREARSEVLSPEAEAFDAGLARTRQGLPLDGADVELASLLAFAERLERDVIRPPMQSGVLETGRARMLREARSRRPSTGVLARIAGTLAPGRALSLPRIATAAVMALAFVLLGGQVLVPVTASALPGDTLYNLKLFGERVQIALAFDPAARERLELEHSRTRGREIEALLAQERTAEIERWRVALYRFLDNAGPDEPPHGSLQVTLRGDDGRPPAFWTLVWDEETRFDLQDRYASPADVPPGTPLLVGVSLEPDQDPYAVSVALARQSEDDPAQTATPDPGATATETEEPAPTDTPDETPDVTATPEESATPTPEESAQPFASDTPDPILTGKPDRDRLRGIVESRSANTAWSIRADATGRGADLRGRLVTVDVSGLPTDRIDRVQAGDWVQMVGRYVDREQTSFVAQSLDHHVVAKPGPALPSCSTNQAIGYVSSYTPVTSLTLTDGSVYDLSGLGAQVAPAGLQVGSRVRLEYKDCGDGVRLVQSLEMLDRPAETLLRGTVEGAGDKGFVLVTRKDVRFLVVVDAATSIVGASRVTDGQTVQVRGWMDDADVLHATEIRVRDGAEPAETNEPITAVPPVAPTIAPTPTPEILWFGPAPISQIGSLQAP